MLATTNYREAFAVPGPGPYLLAHSVGCATHNAVQAVRQQFVDPWVLQGADAWPEWLRCIDEFRFALAAFLGGSANEYCPQNNLSAGLTNILGSFPLPDPERRVWLAAEDSFPSMGFVLQQAQRLGYDVRLIPRGMPPDVFQSWADAMTDDVCAVLITHVHFNSGRVAPVRQIAQLCRERAILSVLDVAQSAGILPIDVNTLGVDVVLGSCIKWLCGGPGAAFLWVRGALIQTLHPHAVGWFSHENPFEFDIHSYRPAPDARRFWGGTPSVAPYAAATASLRLLQSIGISTVIAHNRSLTTMLRQQLPSCWQDVMPQHATGGTLCLPLGADLAGVQARLSAAGIRFDTRGSTLRMSCHLWNTAAEVELVANAWPQRPYSTISPAGKAAP